MWVTVKFLDRNSFGGTSGSLRWVIRNGKATAATTPITRLATATGSPPPRRCPPVLPHERTRAPPRLAPALRRPSDRPKGQPRARGHDQERPEPIEASGGLVVARLRNVPNGGDIGDQQEGEESG